MCLLLLPLLCKKRKDANNNELAPRPTAASSAGMEIGRKGTRYREDLEKYGPEVAGKNRKKRVGIATA